MVWICLLFFELKMAAVRQNKYFPLVFGLKQATLTHLELVSFSAKGMYTIPIMKDNIKARRDGEHMVETKMRSDKRNGRIHRFAHYVL
jgi:hypothetical protein